MKILFIIHGIHNQVLEMARKKKQVLSAKLGCMIDSCIYGEKKELEHLNLAVLGGETYILPSDSSGTKVIAKSLHELMKETKSTAAVVADGEQSGELAVCLARLLEVPCAAAVTRLWTDGESVFCQKMVYNNMVCADYRLPLNFVISERFAVGNLANKQPEPSKIIELEPCGPSDYFLNSITLGERKERKASPILIAAGMGIQTKEEIVKIREYAKCCGFSFGVSRPVAMRGWADISEIIGVSGEIYAPELTVAIGISGAAAFMAGIEQSRYILAVNSNPDAVIAELSDAMIVDEYQNVLPELFEYLKQWKR